MEEEEGVAERLVNEVDTVSLAYAAEAGLEHLLLDAKLQAKAEKRPCSPAKKATRK